MHTLGRVAPLLDAHVTNLCLFAQPTALEKAYLREHPLFTLLTRCVGRNGAVQDCPLLLLVKKSQTHLSLFHSSRGVKELPPFSGVEGPAFSQTSPMSIW